MRCSICGAEIEAWFEEYIKEQNKLGWYPKLCRTCKLRWALSTGTMAQKQDEWKYHLPKMRKSKAKAIRKE